MKNILPLNSFSSPLSPASAVLCFLFCSLSNKRLWFLPSNR